MTLPRSASIVPDFTRASDASRPSLHYETYREMAGARAELRKSNQWQALQTGVLAAQTAVLTSIHQQMEEVKRQGAETLAIQQELLNREQLQSHLEEFVYQTEKLVAECSDPNTDIPSSSRYFLLMSVQQKIEAEGIGTAIIRGRDNKAAFEQAIAEVQRLRRSLEYDPEVREAIEWARKLEADRQVKRDRLRRQMEPHQRTLELLNASRNSITMRDAAEHQVEQFKSFVPPKLHGPMLVGFALFSLCLFPIMIPAILLGWQVDKDKMNQEKNVALDKQIAAVTEKLEAFQRQLASV